ncbi:cob(I)yrinic acid a,c-diamide adenosyltransferase [Novosphingobium sp. FSY-8]|uniref:Corrinoid adenosyltransferase n=1 Tax=Novosphingobium ovatum TaxID=1908523 RepID=A0ABW9XES6_9SPHN|nr:cob(I)yrinic acid a,c-diamide adenosyltransferase [Novosphingobium ovatum]NBC37053.1 cob(I)yrinic acid a,c-diamide adenosyltransferase [Novosphingobium ovatum]
MVKLNRIYTRTGDNGTTGLVDGSRVAKHAPRMAAIGAVDEANCAIGLTVVALRAEAGGEGDAAILTRIQNDLFDLGADLATPGDDFTPGPMALRILPDQAVWLEGCIDAANAHVPPLTSFVLPGGTEAAARAHIARAATRHAERAMVAMAATDPVNPAALAYINRLSDYLFVLSRAINARAAKNGLGGDVLWVPGANR